MNPNEEDISSKFLQVLAQNKISKNSTLHLTRLKLTGNEPELADLVNFTWVEELEIGGYGADLLYIPMLPPSLKILRIHGRKFTDIQHVAYLTSLQKLQLLSAEQLSDITPLAKLTALKSLHIQQSSVVDLSPLANLPQLTELFLEYALSANNNLIDISPLAHLIHIERLGISHCNISDISPLANLTKIKDLYLSNNPFLSNITPLVSLTALQSLSMSYCNISDISPLAGLPKLKKLSLLGNPLKESVNRGLGKNTNLFPSPREIKIYLSTLKMSEEQKSSHLQTLTPKTKKIKAIKLFPPISEVFDEDTAENQKYFMPLATISLAAIDEALTGQIHLVYYYHDPYCEVAGKAYNDFCDNYLGAFDIINGKYRFKAGFDFFEVNEENMKFMQEEKESYMQQVKKHRLTPSKVVERLGKKPKGLYKEMYPNHIAEENLVFICQVNMLNFIKTWHGADIFLFYDKQNQRAIQIFQWD
jgi:hypothetical protein